MLASSIRSQQVSDQSSGSSISTLNAFAAIVLTQQKQRQVVDLVREAVGHNHAHAVDDVRDARRPQRLPVLRIGLKTTLHTQQRMLCSWQVDAKLQTTLEASATGDVKQHEHGLASVLACATAPPPTQRPGATSEHAFSKAANFWRRAPTSLGGPESSRGNACVYSRNAATVSCLYLLLCPHDEGERYRFQGLGAMRG
jgi:hypothetical protein